VVRVGFVTLAALLLTPAALAVADFRTPNRAAYCGISHGEPPYSLICWTPDDGFTVAMRARGFPQKHYIRQNRGYHDVVGRVLGFNQGWRSTGFRCTSRRTGLTCWNPAGHGWWISRFHGYRLF
jgi:hypothetical protein